jgi:PAS domain S-box-containing protein
VIRRSIHPDDLKVWDAAANAHKGGAFQVEFRILQVNGQYGWRRSHGQPTEFENGQVVRFIGAILDINEERAMLDKLRDNAERLRLAEQSAHFGIWEIDVTTGVTKLSEGAAEVSGRSMTDLETRESSLMDSVHPEDRASTLAGIEMGLRNHKEYQVEFRVVLPDGSNRWCRSHGRVVESNGGKPKRVAGAIIDISIEKAMLHQLRQSAERMRLCEQSAGFGVWELDPQSGVITLSEGAAALHGLGEGPVCVTQEELFTTVHADDVAVAQDATREAFARGGYFQNEFRLQANGKPVRWCRSRRVAELHNNKLARVTGAVIDITREKEILVSLEQARGAAVAAALAKGQFLANMSHEIRTPMNGVVGMASLLLQTDLTAEQLECVQIISRSGMALLGIINDILDFSKMEAGKLAIESLPFDLKNVVNDVADLLRPKAAEQGLKLTVEYPPSLATLFVGDADRIRQVLTNLAANAVKFTAQGSVTIAASRIEGGKGGQARVKLSVTDTGIGIPADKIPILFEKFSQADSSVTRKFGGTGLGLAISKQLVELMDGSIHVESTVEEGSSFWIELPLTLDGRSSEPDAESSLQALRESIVERFESSPARVLVVEDNPLNQKVAGRLLKRIGIRSDLAVNGLEALRMLHTQAYDVVLMDCQMPEMDGYQATAMLRSMEGPNRRVRVIALTADAVGGRERCLAAGMDDFISKPVSLDDLIHVLSDCRVPVASKTNGRR